VACDDSLELRFVDSLSWNMRRSAYVAKASDADRLLAMIHSKNLARVAVDFRLSNTPNMHPPGWWWRKAAVNMPNAAAQFSAIWTL
jgi:hypothetical protein